MELKKILWPTDLSGSAEKALPYVRSLSQTYSTEIHVMYVIEDFAHHKSWYGDFEQSRIEKILEWEEATARKRLNQICEAHLEGCPLYIKHIAIGDPAQEILKIIATKKVDMVVMTSSGQKGFYRFGSVAEKILKSASVPVVTIPISAPENRQVPAF